MSVTTQSHMERLQQVEARLFRRLSGIKKQKGKDIAEVESQGIVWVPPGWGMGYWEKGLRYRQGGGDAIKFAELDAEALHEMVGRLEAFVDFVQERYGVNLEPGPSSGKGVGHLIKYACSKGYREEIKRHERLLALTVGMEKLDAAKTDAEGKLKTLEVREAELLDQGKAAKNPEIRGRVIPQIVQVRKDIARELATVSFVNAKTEASKVALHNSRLVALGEIAGLPDAEEMVEAQVMATEAAEQVEAALAGAESVNFDFASDDMELEIAKELAADDKPQVSDKDRVAEAAILDELNDDDSDDEDEEAEQPNKAEEKEKLA